MSVHLPVLLFEEAHTETSKRDATNIPTQPKPEKKTVTVQAKISHYNPALGGVNCSNFVNGKCVSRMASGASWEKWMNKACACPKEYPFGTKFILPDGSKWVCMDRGGKIVTEADGTIWLDLLTRHTSYHYGKVVKVQVVRK